MRTELANRLLAELQDHPEMLSYYASQLVEVLQADANDILVAARELELETRGREDFQVSITHEKNYANQTVNFEVMLIPMNDEHSRI